MALSKKDLVQLTKIAISASPSTLILLAKRSLVMKI